MFLKNIQTTQVTPFGILAVLIGLGNGKVDNSPLVSSIGLKIKNVYIRGCCGGGWVGLAPSKFAIWRDRGIQKWPEEDFAQVWKKVDFWKLLGMGWPGVGNVPRPCGSILHLSRGSQEPYKRKTNFSIFFI